MHKVHKTRYHLHRITALSSLVLLSFYFLALSLCLPLSLSLSLSLALPLPLSLSVSLAGACWHHRAARASVIVLWLI